MNPRQAVHFLKTRTGAFLIFAVLCIGGYLIVRGFQPEGFGKKSPPLEDAKPASSPQTVQSITRNMTPFRPPQEPQPMFVVPNHMLDQFATELLALYPNANILAAGKADFAKDRRAELFSRIATGNWDAVIVTHSSFEKIPLDFDTRKNFIKDQIDEIKDAIREQKGDSSGTRLVKELERVQKRLEVKLEKLSADDKKDATLTFEELGVDRLFVDEAHKFKNLFYVTKMTRVAGLPQTASERAFDLFLKVQHIQDRNEGGGVVFATGTPTRYLAGEDQSDDRLFRFDMSEYQTQETLGLLLGASSNETGMLGRVAERSAHGTLLFDEIEKAHPRIMDVFLQILDAARVTVADGTTLDLSGFYVVFTSNIGSAELMDWQHSSLATMERHVLASARQWLRPELFARITEKLVFQRLDYDTQVEIARLMLEGHLLLLEGKGHRLVATPEVLPFLVRKGFHPKLGARSLRDCIEKLVGDAVAVRLLTEGRCSGILHVEDEALVAHSDILLPPSAQG